MVLSAVVMIKIGPVEPMMAIGIPPKRAYVQPTQEVARIVSMAPISLLVTVPYTAPKVRVGATTEMNMSIETAMVFWLKFFISC
jgi:hypothetical protein